MGLGAYDAYGAMLIGGLVALLVIGVPVAIIAIVVGNQVVHRAGEWRASGHAHRPVTKSTAPVGSIPVRRPTRRGRPADTTGPAAPA